MHYVYKYVLDGEIIYIGKSDAKKPFSRLRQHGISGDNIPCEYHSLIKSADIFYYELPNAIMTDVVESELIRRYKPKLNKDSKATSEWGGLAFVEPEWVEYRKKYTQEQRQELLEQVELSRKSVRDIQARISKLINTKLWLSGSCGRYASRYHYGAIGIDNQCFIGVGTNEEKQNILNGFTISIDGILSYNSKPPIITESEFIRDNYDLLETSVLVKEDKLREWLDTECQPILEKLKDIEFEISNYRLSA